tara:strand:- start:1985 stop:2626 length:642 start_codon:yes stop_codon:yes gene_type:complete
MGFLDHSTNNIVVDAVLTDKGRELISEGNLNIASFAFFDDEVDYTLIQKYGRVIGKEKIEKNTPIFEASTNSVYSAKHSLYTGNNVSTSHTGFIPFTISVTESTINQASTNQTTITLSTSPTDRQKYQNGSIASPGDVVIQYNSDFLSLVGGSIESTATWNNSSPVSDWIFEINANGASKTQYLQNNQVTVPVTVRSQFGPQKTTYITVQYTQ